jgi:hypothetical protein
MLSDSDISSQRHRLTPYHKTRVGEIHVRQIRVRNKGTMATPIPALLIPKRFAALHG